MRKRAKRQGLAPLVAALFVLPCLMGGAAAQTASPSPDSQARLSPAPRHFALNAQMIEDLTTPDPKACDPQSVLTDLLRQIGPTARVYPGENYYYFQFYRAGASYSGNLRFSIDDRDQGVVGYACYPTYASWLEPDDSAAVGAELSAKDGVHLTPLGGMDYELRFGGLSTRFSLNDVDQTPNPAALAPDERFLGRSFDDSGLPFDLVYNPKRKSFLFVLDTRGPVSESFFQVSPDVYLGRRTGFVFYQEDAPKRMVLIAVHSDEAYKNSWYDGPFDHLAENFYAANGFWDAVYAATPELKGKLTPGGRYIGRDIVFALIPYREYTTEDNLDFIKDCVRLSRSRGDRIACLTVDPGQ